MRHLTDYAITVWGENGYKKFVLTVLSSQKRPVAFEFAEFLFQITAGLNVFTPQLTTDNEDVIHEKESFQLLMLGESRRRMACVSAVYERMRGM